MSDVNCFICGEEASLRCTRCAGSNVTGVYCSQEHQAMSWKLHKQLCDKSQTRVRQPFYTPLEYYLKPALSTGTKNGPEVDNAEICKNRMSIIHSISAEDFDALVKDKSWPFYYISSLDTIRLLDPWSTIYLFTSEYLTLAWLLNLTPISKKNYNLIKSSVKRLRSIWEEFEEPKVAWMAIELSSKALDAAEGLESAYLSYLKIEITEVEFNRRNRIAIQSLHTDSTSYDP